MEHRGFEKIEVPGLKRYTSRSVLTGLQVPVASMSCYCCGAKGHRGENCPHETRPHLNAERQGDVMRAQVGGGLLVARDDAHPIPQYER